MKKRSLHVGPRSLGVISLSLLRRHFACKLLKLPPCRSRMAFIAAKLARLTTGQGSCFLRPVLAFAPFKADYNCWSCSKHLNKYEQKQYFCPCERQVILPVDSSKERNYFEMFNLQENFRLDGKALTNRFRQLIRKLHPDIFNTKSEV